MEPNELGTGIASLRVTTTADVRETLTRSLVQAEVGVLQVSKEKELENKFLELLGEGEQPGRKRRKKKQADADAASHAGTATETNRERA